MRRTAPLAAGGLLLAFLTSSGPAVAQQRYFAGSRNLGMGGTGVASTTNGLAVHYNPAGMAFDHGWDLQFPLITAEAGISGDLLANLDNLRDRFPDGELSDLQERLDNGDATPQDLADVLETFLYDLAAIGVSGSGGDIRAVSGPAFRYKNWGLSISAIGTGGVAGILDLENGLSLGRGGFRNAIPDPVPGACGGDPFCEQFAQSLVVESGGQLDPARAETLVATAGPERLQQSPTAQDVLTRIVAATAAGDDVLALNRTGAGTTALVAAQFAGTYSHLVYRDKLSVGGTLRVMRGGVRSEGRSVARLQTGSDALDDAIPSLNDDITSSTELGFDLGVMYRPTRKLSFGLVGSSINEPSFEIPGTPREYRIESLYRAGVAYRPLRWFNFAVDVDLNEINSQVIPTLDYRYVNAGVEFLAGRVFSGWLGAYRNVAEDTSNAVYTGGAGLRFGRFEMGLSIAVAPGQVQVQSGEDEEDFPNAAAAALTISWQPRRNPS